MRRSDISSERSMGAAGMAGALIAFLFLLPAGPTASLFGQSDAFLQEEGAWEVWISGGGGSTTTLFDTDGTQRLFDTAGTTFGAWGLSVSADYGISDRLELNLSLPIGYYTLTSDRRFPDRSILAPAWLGIGATWGITTGEIRTAAGVEVRIPHGFHQGIYDDPNHPSFLSDGFLEVRGSLMAAYATPKFWIKGSAGYALRGEEPVDELFGSVQVGHSSVAGTGIFIGVEGVTSTSDPSEPTRPFYAGADGDLTEFSGGVGRMRTIEREAYLTVAPGAFFDLRENLTISTQYRLRLLGVHTVRLNGLFAGVGLRF